MKSSVMDSRRRLVLDVRERGLSLSEACREAGVTRKTGRKWMKRSEVCELSELAELSRAPHRVASRTAPEVEEALLAMKALYPEWGARKLCTLLEQREGLRLPSRTADRVLKRRGMTQPGAGPAPEMVRFERNRCGALLQVDFKGLPKSVPYCLLTVLDDHSRFCLSFTPVKDKLVGTVQEALWETFGVHGLPESILMDNGDCFGRTSSKCPTQFEAWLMRLGIKPIHGRPAHPQTQGKVERFHQTAKDELGDRLMQKSVREFLPHGREFVDRYNWVRPHDALAGKAPGALYAPFSKKRPENLPVHVIEPGVLSRKVDPQGHFGFDGNHYKAGKGLVGERVVLKEDEFGLRLFYAGFPLPYLRELTTRYRHATKP